MHIVLSGYFGFHNAGDEAILSSMIKQLRTVNPHVRMTVLTNDEVHTTTTYGVESVNRWKIADIIKVLKKADGLISGGGSLLQDATGPKSIIYYTTIINITRWLRKPVFVYAQGMGPFHKSYLKILVKYSLNRVSRLTVRDEDSRELLQSVGVHKTIEHVHDPVLGMEVPSSTPKWLVEQKIDNPVITFSVRDWVGKHQYVPKIASAADQLTSMGYTIIFVPMHGNSDYSFSQTIQAHMKHDSFLFPADATIEEIVAMIGASELLIGMRLHALIFAAISETPFVPISYDPKIDAFAQSYEHPVRFHVEQDGWYAEDLLAQAIQTLQEKTFIQAKLKKINMRTNAAVLQTATEALRLFSTE